VATFELQPLVHFSLTNAEASADVEAGMAVSYLGKKLASGEDEKFAGIAKFTAEAGEAITLQHGIVEVQVTGTGSANAQLIQGATAGKLAASAGTTVLVLGFALEAWTAAATIRAFIFPSPRRPALT
jgi:hypothetical protein